MKLPFDHHLELREYLKKKSCGGVDLFARTGAAFVKSAQITCNLFPKIGTITWKASALNNEDLCKRRFIVCQEVISFPIQFLGNGVVLDF